MSKIALPYTIANGDPVDAGPVESNYQTIERHTNQEVIERCGTVAMTAQLKLFGNPVAVLDAAPKQYVDQMLPIRIITMFGGAAAPPGGVWLLCDGTEYQTATYPDLSQILGGVSGRFNVPNLVDRFAMGSSATRAVNTQGGSADAVVIAHTHPIDHTHAGTTSGNDSPDHSHLTPDHLHGSGSLYAAVPNHQHGDISGQAFIISWGFGGPTLGMVGPPGAVPGNTSSLTGAAGGGNFGVGGQTGASDRTLQSGGANTRHSHSVPAIGFSGASQSTGVVGTGLNVPPYYVVAYIIRAK